MTFPEPYRARPARLDDLGHLVELFEARDLADVGFVDQAREEILEDWAAPFVDLERDSVIVEAPDESIVAYGIVVALDPTVQVAAIGRVHPAHAGRGLGSTILTELERRARSRLDPAVSSPFRVDTPETDHAARELFIRRGYRHARSSWLMERSLPAYDVERLLPDGITLRTGAVSDESAVHALVEASFQEHFGYEPVSFDEWRRWVGDTPGYDPSLTVLAFAGERPAGVSVNFASDDGIGWIGELGVAPGFRRRGIASALLVRSFALLAESGHQEVRLGVDAENSTGATRLYKGVGMTVRRRFDLYEKQLSGA